MRAGRQRIEHHAVVPESVLANLNGRWWDWRVEGWDGGRLRLIAGNDLTYHHQVEVTFGGVAYVCCPSEFSHPVFRDPHAEEVYRATRVLDGELGGLAVFAWDIDTSPAEPCMVVAEAVDVAEGLVTHVPPAQ
jgi:hypothetical protein